MRKFSYFQLSSDCTWKKTNKKNYLQQFTKETFPCRSEKRLRVLEKFFVPFIKANLFLSLPDYKLLFTSNEKPVKSNLILANM